MELDQDLLFGEYLRAIRGEKSLGQIELQTGISKSHLSKIERGERSVPKPELLKKLAIALNVNYYELLEKAGYIDEDITIVDESEKQYFRVMKNLKAKGISADTIEQLALANEIANNREVEGS